MGVIAFIRIPPGSVAAHPLPAPYDGTIRLWDATSRMPKWSPDGRHIIFSTNRETRATVVGRPVR